MVKGIAMGGGDYVHTRVSLGAVPSTGHTGIFIITITIVLEQTKHGAEDKDFILRFLPNPLSLVSLSVQSLTRWADMSHSGNAQRLNSLLPPVPD